MSDETYKPRAYMNAVLKASSATHSAAHVLRVMCWRADWDRPEVTITKPQIADETGLKERAVQYALKLLREDQSIEVIHNGLGGRGNAPTYRLLVADKGSNNCTKGSNNCTKGSNNNPPTIDSMDSMSERPGASRSGSVINRVGGNRSATSSKGRKFAEKQQLKKLTDAQKTEVDRFSKAIRHAGSYGPAKRLIEAWDAGDIEEPTE